jgi:hypothetical protein
MIFTCIAPNDRGFVGERRRALDLLVEPLERVVEQNDEWQLQHRYMQVEVMAELTAATGAGDPRQIPCAA